jgi:uncharacterized protein
VAAYANIVPGPKDSSLRFSIALAYVSAFLLWLNNQRAAFLNGIAAIGRTALTNYLLQSIILGFIFYGYGLGLFGRIGSAPAAGIGLLLYVAQVQLSKLWLERFRFGPFEWLWRSVTYGHQPMLREHSLPSQAAIDQGGSK